MWRGLRALLPLALATLLLVPLPRAAQTLPTELYGVAPLGSSVVVTLPLQNPSSNSLVVSLHEARALPVDQGTGRGPLQVPLPEEVGPIAPSLRAALAAAPTGRVEMLVFLDEQADLHAASRMEGWAARGQSVVATLEAQAEQGQAPLLRALRGRGVPARAFWIVNALLVEGDDELAEWLAVQPGVALLTANHRYTLPDAPSIPRTPLADTVAWGVARIGAPEVWATWGVQGEGIVVATMDSGADVQHPALLPTYRGWSSAGLSHDYNWGDFAVRPAVPAPTDTLGHGTHVLGTILGQPVSPTIGVAPGAEWIAVRVCAIFCRESDLIAGAQWLLAPTDRAGRNPRPDLRPHLVNNSWSGLEEEVYSGFVAAWYAAGIFPVFANGNRGPFCGTSEAPALDPRVLAVGAADEGDKVATFSSRGPVADGRIKPDLVAPGVDILSAEPGGGYGERSGTSMASPHAAGVVALLWSANPDLVGDVDGTRALLSAASQPHPSTRCGDAPSARPNSEYGFGHLDAVAVLEAGRVDLPWLSAPLTVTVPPGGALTVPITLDARRVAEPGRYTARLLLRRGGTVETIPIRFEVEAGGPTTRLHGRLVDEHAGYGLRGQVQVREGPILLTDAAGHFSATLPLRDYHLWAEAPGFLPRGAAVTLDGARELTIPLTADLPRLVGFPPDPPSVLTALAFGEEQEVTWQIQNGGTRPLTLRSSVPTDEWTVQPLTVTRLYNTDALPTLDLETGRALTTPLTMPFAIPIFGGYSDRLYVSANGWASVTQPGGGPPLVPQCLPGGFLDQALAPFWATLDASRGGAIRAGSISPDIFVVSWEQVPLWEARPGTDTPHYTFQLALHRAGHIEFRYGAMGRLPTYWVAGTAYSAVRGQTLACHEAPQSLAFRGWLALSQPLPTLWLAASPEELLLQPGEHGTVRLRLRGLAPAPWRDTPSRARLLLHTNDPGRPLVEWPVAARIGEAPVQVILPAVGR